MLTLATVQPKVNIARKFEKRVNKVVVGTCRSVSPS